MTDLFKKITPEMEKVAGVTKLSDNVDDWSHEITNEAYTQLPFISGKEIMVDLSTVNPDNKSGIGSIVIGEGKKNLSVPLIIKEGELSPLDTLVVNGNIVPATESKINEYFYDPTVFGGLMPRQLAGLNSGLDTSMFPFNLDTNTVGADMRQSFIGKVAHTLSPKIFDEKIAAIKEEPFTAKYLLEKMESIKTIMTHEKVAALAPKYETPKAPDLDAGIVFNSEGTIKAVGLTRTPFKIFDYSGADLTKIASKVEKSPVMLGKGDGIFEIKKLASKTGRIMVPGYGEGHLFTKVADIDGTEIDTQLFIGKDFYGLNENIEGEPMTDKVYKEDNISNGKGVFYYDTEEGQEVTFPMEIQGRMNDEYSAIVETGELIKFGLSENVKRPIKVASSHYLLPSSSKFIKLSSRIKEIVPIKSEYTSNEHKINMTKADKGYRIAGEPVGQDLGILPEKIASLVLLGLGASEKQVDQLVKLASLTNKDISFYTKYKFVKKADTVEKVKSLREKVAANIKGMNHTDLAFIAKHINEPNVKEFMKLAAGGSDETVDSLLSLDFVNPDNIETFVDLLPKFTDTASQLSSLLMAARLGITGLPEKAIVNSIRNLIKVIKSLQLLKEGLKREDK